MSSSTSTPSKHLSLPSAAEAFEDDYTSLEKELDSANFTPGYPAVAPSTESVATSVESIYTKYLDTLDAYKWPTATSGASRALEEAVAAMITASRRAAHNGAFLDSQQFATAGDNEYYAEGWVEYTLGIVSGNSCLWALDNPANGKHRGQRSPTNWSKACPAAGLPWSVRA